MIRGFYITVNNVKIYCETNDGPKDKAAIVCLHTAGRENRQYHGIMEILADKYNVCSFDLPAHGKSWPLPGNKVINTNEEYGRWVWDVISALKIENPIVIGCSMGGNIVYYMAQNYPVRAICSMQGADYTPSIDANILELLNHPYVSCQHSHVEFSECLIGRKCPPDVKDFIMWGVAQEISVTKQGDLTMYNGFDVRDKMDKVTCPVLIIHGLDDAIVPAKKAEDSAARLTKAKKVVYCPVEDYGHFIILEAPEIVCGHLSRFIESI